MAVSEAMIEIKDLHKTFRRGRLSDRLFFRSRQTDHPVLRGIDLELAQGEFVGLLGLNGAGKTTILKTVATVLTADSGTVRVLGYDADKEGRHVRDRLGYVLADERSFYWRLSARANLEFFASLDNLHGSAARARIDYLLARMDLLKDADQPVQSYSTGMKQRLAIVRGLMKRPRVLLMDEPTRSIDSVHSAEVWLLVRQELEENHGCLLMVTHQIQEALSVCNRIAILSDGQIVLDTTAAMMERHTVDRDGFTVSVRGLELADLEVLRSCDGVLAVHLAGEVAGEQFLDIRTRDDEEPLAGVIGRITEMGGTVCSLKRVAPLQGVVERLLAGQGEATR